MSDVIRAGVLLTLRDQFSTGMRNAGGAAGQFGTSVTGAMDSANRAISRVGGALATLGLGFGAGAAVNHVVALEARITRLGTQANVSQERVKELSDRIYEVSQAPDIKIESSEMLDAIDAIIERTGDLDFVENNLRSIGLAIQATGAAGSDIGGLLAEFQKMGLGVGEVTAAIDTLALQGKNGAFTMEHLAGLGPRVISAYTATGRTGLPALREMGAALQVIRMGTGSSEMAATAFEAMMRTLRDPKKQEDLKAMGVDVRDTLTDEFRPIHELMEEIVVKSSEAGIELSTVFEAEAIRAFNFAVGRFKDTGSIDVFRRFFAMIGEGATITEDSARNAQTMQANLALLREGFLRFADRRLTEPIENLAEAFNEFSEDPEQLQRAFDIALAGLGGIAALRVGSSVIGLLAGWKSLRSGSAALGASAAASGAAQPVFVTNWPAGGAGGSGTYAQRHAQGRRAGSGVSPAGPASVAARTGASAALAAAGSAAKGALPWAAGLNIIQTGVNIYRNRDLSDEERRRENTGEIFAAFGGTGGAVAGMAAGAALGSVVPIFGTIGGGVIGFALGAAGYHFGRQLGGVAGREIGSLEGVTASTFGYTPEEVARLRNTYGMKAYEEAAHSRHEPPSGEIRQKVEVEINDRNMTATLETLSNTVPGLSTETGRAAIARRLQ